MAFQRDAFQNDAFDGSSGRVAQLPVEALVSPTDQKARVAQEPVEVLVSPTDQKARVAQAVIEVLVGPLRHFTLDAEIVGAFALVTGSFVADAATKREQVGSFTADAVLRREQTGSFSADALIKREQTGSLSANAVLFKATSGSFTANAHIPGGAIEGALTADAVLRRLAQGAALTADAVLLRTQTGSLTANAVILRTQTGSFTANAAISGSVTSSLTANAVIKRTQTGSLTANAVIKKTPTPTFTANADIYNGTITGSFTANAALLKSQTVSFTANAVILKRIFFDDFNRTVVGGLGGPWSWYWGDSNQGSSATALGSVNGSEAVFGQAASAYESWVGIPRPDTGDAFFDFFVPATAASNSRPNYGLTLDVTNYRGIYVQAPVSGSNWNIRQAFSADTPTTFNPDENTWYRLHARWTGTRVLARVWRRADAEPTTWAYDQASQFNFAGDTSEPPFLDMYYVAVAGDAKWDNVEIWSSASTWRGYGGFQADAEIYVNRITGSLTANAVRFKNSGTKTFTARAWIIKSRVEGSFTANAVIKKTGIAGSFTANAYLFDGFGSGSFTASAIIFLGTTSSGGGQTGGALPPMVVVITYDDPGLGLVDITADVDIATAEFVSYTNGGTGQARLRVRDTSHIYSFMTGRELTLTIDGRSFWGGWVMQARRTYPFPVLDSTVAATTARYWDLTGFDYGFLFERRIVYSTTSPKTRTNWTYPAGTYDDTIINDIFDHYIPGLVDDGLSRSGVERVDVAILDIPNVTSATGGEVAATGDTWRQMMDQITRATGGVYYIDPRKVLHYTDVDTADAAYVLTDTPSLPVDVGYQKFALNDNGTMLVNDYILWGAAIGSSKMVLAHVTDAASITTHNRWQAGSFNGGMYRQTSVDISADSMVNGTPQNRRGHKDDAVSFTCTVFHPVFFLGQKVNVVSDIYGYDDVLPIRVMRITFANPQQAIFELTLSHSIDDIWTTFEQKWPKVIKPPTGGKPPPPPPPGGGGGGGVECPPFDDFDDRTVAIGWGTGAFGGAWSAYGPGGYTNAAVENGYAKLEQGPGFTGGQTGRQIFDTQVADGQFYRTETFSMVTRLKVEAASDGSEAFTGFYFDQDFGTFGRTGFGVSKNVGGGSSGGLTLFYDDTSIASVQITVSKTISVGSHYLVRYERTGVSQRVKLWDDGTSEPEAWWDLDHSGIPHGAANEFRIIHTRGSESSLDWKVWYDYIRFCQEAPLPASGYVCEDLTYTTGYSYQASNAYQAGSTEVWVNGLRVVRGSNGYIEFDPNAGTILFSTPRNSNDIVRMCYEANGIPG